MPSSRTNKPQSQEQSSDWFSSDPAVYVQALDEFEQSLAQQDPKQQVDKEQEIEIQEVQPPPTPHKRSHGEVTGDYIDSHTYGASTFGGFGEYMARKRAKLQVQNQTLTSVSELETTSKIFQGVGIYVRGNPAVRVPGSLPKAGGRFHHTICSRTPQVNHRAWRRVSRLSGSEVARVRLSFSVGTFL